MRGRHRARKPHRKKRRFFRRFWWVFVLVPLLGVAGVLGTLYYVYLHLQLPLTPPPVQTTYIYDSRGDLITTLHQAVNRTLIPLKDMPQSLREAVVATEDKGFYRHPGIDPAGIVRAAWNDLVAHKAVQGGSTITQQLVKNVYAGHYVTDPKTGGETYVVPPRTFSQKIREALLAVKLEQTFSKGEILAGYLNTIYFWHGAYGVQAAAKTYWNKDAKDLTLPESAALAGLIASPSTFDPVDHPVDARIRRDYVLDRMVAEGYVTAAEATRIKEKKVRIHPIDILGNYPHAQTLGYFVDYVKRSLYGQSDKSSPYSISPVRLPESQVFGGGLRITTTLNMNWQRAAENAIHTHLPDPGDPAAALVAIDPRTGAVRAMYGGRDFFRSQVNLATGQGGSGRTAGSAFKPFTLAAAMEDRISLASRWRGPGTITIPASECFTNGRPWTLSNASDEESGIFTLAQATAHSVNTVFAQLAAQVGPRKVAGVAHRMGIRSPLEPVCSITLGTQAVDPLEMTNAYATLAAEGMRRWATPLQRLEGPDGQVLFRLTHDRGKQVIDQNDANLVTSALEGVITGGTGTAANIARPAAGKTGTAQNYVDAWFCGYTRQLATCVWMGYPKNDTTPMQSVEGVSPVFGGTIPAAIWHDFMAEVTTNMPVVDFPTPSAQGYDQGPATPVPAPAPSPTKSPKPSPSPSESPSPRPTESPSPSPTESPSPSPSPIRGGAAARLVDGDLPLRGRRR